MHATLHHIEATTPTTWTFWFTPEKPLRFEAGQYVPLLVPHTDVDNRGNSRWMSLSNSPDDSLLSIVTMFSEPSSSYKRALRALKPGANVEIGEPIGDFVLPKSKDIPLAFIVGGIGSAPVRSIVRWLTDHNELRSVQLIYSASSPEEIAYTDVLEAYAPLTFMPIVTHETDAWSGLSGRLSAVRALELIGTTDGKLIYLCGPQSLIEPLFNDLVALGIQRSQLVLDYFPGY